MALGVLDEESENLAVHTHLCAERYKDLERRFAHVERRIEKVEQDIQEIKTSMAENFSEIKILIERQNNARTIQVIASLGAVAAAVVGVLGYLLTH